MGGLAKMCIVDKTLGNDILPTESCQLIVCPNGLQSNTLTN